MFTWDIGYFYILKGTTKTNFICVVIFLIILIEAE